MDRSASIRVAPEPSRSGVSRSPATTTGEQWRSLREPYPYRPTASRPNQRAGRPLQRHERRDLAKPADDDGRRLGDAIYASAPDHDRPLSESARIPRFPPELSRSSRGLDARPDPAPRRRSAPPPARGSPAVAPPPRGPPRARSGRGPRRAPRPSLPRQGRSRARSRSPC
jgi:hypothetical protein